MTINEWLGRHFEKKSRPKRTTVLRWLRNYTRGRTPGLPGRKLGKTWYVDEAKWLADGDELVEQVLRG